MPVRKKATRKKAARKNGKKRTARNPKAAGRPSAIDAKMAERILETRRTEPGGLKRLCEDHAWMPHGVTVWRHMLANPKFRSQYNDAHEEQIRDHVSGAQLELELVNAEIQRVEEELASYEAFDFSTLDSGDDVRMAEAEVQIARFKMQEASAMLRGRLDVLRLRLDGARHVAGQANRLAAQQAPKKLPIEVGATENLAELLRLRRERAGGR